MTRTTLSFLLISFTFGHNGDRDRKIEFPNLPGLKTLVCDLHMHTVFSDGSVWPNIRVMEANKDGLDVIATTEHLEYQSWISDIHIPIETDLMNLLKVLPVNQASLLLMVLKLLEKCLLVMQMQYSSKMQIN